MFILIYGNIGNIIYSKVGYNMKYLVFKDLKGIVFQTYVYDTITLVNNCGKPSIYCFEYLDGQSANVAYYDLDKYELLEIKDK